jgi:hypothetical protein
MAENLKPEQLKNSGNYTLIRILRHNEIVPFVLSEVRQLRWPMLVFYGFCLLVLIMILAFSIASLMNTNITWGLYWKYLFFGFLSGMLIVIPFHELLHGLAYKISGAKKIKYGADLKQLLFYASAPGFVTERIAFYFIAFCPFIIINLFFLAGFIYGTPAIQWGSLVALFVHSTMCIGDFAMVNFFAAYPRDRVFTFDEEKSGISYFYMENKHESRHHDQF